ncbi:hypothetical protein MATR_02080 [Marivirga tractuosa]|uniref:DUF4440 domain-containing protein n=1 Tax=Marivirga tractuosa (strain ATCC 23168 / DSM 4126 / NBRC 15989 / NCIMB 1408 / VKM B-1430 / H-43) TaxID=643867 RepID=E4TV61_MARTH|nr:hypothetical protein [Marivirga tractuosa]ADR22154.1 hypothetical protein Ftrac_2172 [Marivirga tractuosa DSM 4126]BDD13383.1 hypothetical protein MATR_02080 [Marivirga tractuosa]
MNNIKRLLVLILTISSSQANFAQEYDEDVKSIESIMSALTDVISGPADRERDWNRFEYLFSEDAKLIPTQKIESGEVTYHYWTPQEYVEMYQKNRGGTAFYEQELHRITESFGNIAHCFSTYAVRTSENGPIERRGINSIQLLRGKDRWYIISVFWSNESDDEKIPREYLTNEK